MTTTHTARARAIQRGAAIAAEDLASAGSALTLEDVQARLNGAAGQSIEMMVMSGELLVLPDQTTTRRYPAIQFNDDGTIVPGLREVQVALPDRNGWTVLNFLIHPDPRLGDQRPIDLLRNGQTAAVVAAAKLVGEPGA